MTSTADALGASTETPLTADSARGLLPSVGVVLATHNRPELMRRALASILEQEYAGDISVWLVFDRSELDHSLTLDRPGRRVTVGRNTRSPGLAGARNTGILALETDLVAFCDDDDVWLPNKLKEQVTRLEQEPGAEFVTTAMRVDFRGESTVRVARTSSVTLQDMARSRMAMLHSSSFLFRRDAMIDGFGLVDEDLPNSMAEDWDLLLRAARRRPIAHVDEPMVGIQWGAASYFNDAWRDKNTAHLWLLTHHDEIRESRVGASLLYGKLAFGHAMLKQRRQALRYVARCIRVNPSERRWPLTILVLLGVSGQWIQETLNRRGHGI